MDKKNYKLKREIEMKNNGNNWKILGVILALTLAIGSWVWNAAIVYGRVEQNTQIISKIESNIIPKIDEHDLSILGIRKDLKHLKEKVDENVQTQKEILSVQMQILKEMRN